MDDKKKKFVVPEANVVEFTKDDIITISGFAGTLWWGGDDNKEDF